MGVAYLFQEKTLTLGSTYFQHWQLHDIANCQILPIVDI